jgi:DNA recombination protein RmuC
MMFVPIEGAYIAAMQGNPNLWNEAYKKNVLLISPTNLIAALRLIVDMWDRDKQSKNAEEIAERGGKLYEKFVGFLASMDDIGNALKKSNNSYEKALSQLSEGRGNLVNQARHLEKLGIKYNKSKQIPSDFIKEDDTELPLIQESNE